MEYGGKKMIQNILATGYLFTGIFFTISIWCRLHVMLAKKEGQIWLVDMIVFAIGWTGFVATMWIF